MYNSIFGTSSYTWVHGTRVPLEFFQGTQVPWTRVLHMELEFQKIHIYIFNFQFVITQLSKNRILKWNSIFRKSSFKTWTFPYLVWKMGQNARFFFKKKGQKPIFSAKDIYRLFWLLTYIWGTSLIGGLFSTILLLVFTLISI